MVLGVLAFRGRREESWLELQRARELDPLSLIINNSIGYKLFLERKYDAAIEQSHRTLELDPEFWLAHFNLASALVEQGLFDAALLEFQKARQLSGDHPLALAGLGNCYARMGRKAQARNTLRELEA